MLLHAVALALATLQTPATPPGAPPGAPTRGAEALSLFGTTDDDRTLVYIASGPPATRTRVDCRDLFRAAEVWTYAEHPRLGAGARLVFFPEEGSGEYRYWTVGAGDAVLIAAAQAGKVTLEELAARKAGCAEAPALVEAVRAVRARQRDAEGALADRSAIVAGARSRPARDVSPKRAEDRRAERRAPARGADAIELPAGASPLRMRQVVRFPEARAGGTKVELALAVDRESLSARPLGDETFFGVDVAGEVRKSGKVVDDFRYRFEFPASSLNGPSVPLAIERELPAGDYTLKVLATDLYANSAALLTEALNVPDSVEPSLGKEEQAVREAAREAAKASAEARAGAGGGAKGALTLVPPLSEAATGLLRVETRVSSSAVAWAEFYLDGARVLTKRRPPFDVDLDLGEAPRRRVVKVIAYDKAGKVVSEDEMTLNEGREAFRVRIASPEKGTHVSGPTNVVAEISIPGTRRLKQLEIFVDDARAAVLYKPPFAHVVDVPASASIGLLRAVATLDDGTSAEDVRYFNAPSFLSEMDVNAVELYTAVFAKGRPVTGLSKESFRVLEDGVPQDVGGFEVVTRLPLALGLAFDTSGSMEKSMDDARKAATQFLKDVMTPKDRCFLVTFADETRLASPFTTDREHLAQVLGDVRANGLTALWDALQTGLFQFQGIRGRKAFVVLTDGEDSASKTRYDTVLDYAKKSGVPVYFIGMGIPVARMDIRFKLGRIARETGGAVYQVDTVRGLAKIYDQIDEELRSQYVLSYVPKNAAPNGKWRKVEVKMSPGDLTARTISGYYP